VSNTDFFKCVPTRLDYFSKTSEEYHAKYEKSCDYAVRSFALKPRFFWKSTLLQTHTLVSIYPKRKSSTACFVEISPSPYHQVFYYSIKFYFLYNHKLGMNI
jgi:hypothetical protein